MVWRVPLGEAAPSRDLTAVHLAQDLMEEINFARQGKRPIGIVAILHFSLLKKHLEQGMVCVLRFDHEPLFLRADIDREATFRS